MKLLVILLLAINLSFAGVKPPNSIKIEDYYKVEKTVSGEISNSKTFHLIVAKNRETRDFEIIPLINDGKSFSRLTSLSFKDEPSLLSFHTKGDILSLITATDEESGDLMISDIDIVSGEVNQSNSIPFSGFISSVKSKGDSVLVFLDKDELNIMKIKNATTVESTKTIQKNDNNEALFKNLKKETIDNVVTDEFVANGSIKDFRVYLNDEDFFITQQDEKKNLTIVYSLNIETTSQTDFNISKFDHLKGFKRTTSFLKDNTLVRLSLGRSNGVITFNSLDNTWSKEIKIAENLISNSSKEFGGLEDFLKQASKDANAPTITLNENKKGNFVVRADYVSKNEYMYNNWWWINLHQQMMMQQQQMQNSMRTFGPSDDFEMYLSFMPKAEKHFFEFVVDTSFEVTKDQSELNYKEIDKPNEIEIMGKKTKLKVFSTVFLDNEFRFFGYDKKNDSFKIFSKEY